MRELDVQYPKHRNDFIKSLKKQTDLWLKGIDEEMTTYKKRGRKPSKSNKNIETEPNTKMYAPKRY